MEFRILGPLEVTQDGRALELGATKQQTLLAVLLLHAGEIVSPTRLMTELWGEDPPSTAAKGIQGYVSSLRRILGADAIATRAHGYVLAPEHLDAALFERLAAEGRYREALALWRGEPLHGVELEGPAAAEVERLGERRLGDPRAADRGRPRGGPRRRAGRRAAAAGCGAPAARAPARAAHARALPRGPPGRRAGGLPRHAQLPRRRAGAGAGRGAAAAAAADAGPVARARRAGPACAGAPAARGPAAGVAAQARRRPRRDGRGRGRTRSRCTRSSTAARR